MRCHRSLLLFLALPGVALAEPVGSVHVVFPAGIRWVRVTDEASPGGHRREWLPAGESLRSVSWLVMEQKRSFESIAGTRAFLGIQFAQARLPCGTLRQMLNPEPVTEATVRSFIGVFHCEERTGDSVGVVTDEWVLTGERVAYVVTSLRMRMPMPARGADLPLPARQGGPAAAAALPAGRLERDPASVRIGNGVAHVCVDPAGCPEVAFPAKANPIR